MESQSLLVRMLLLELLKRRKRRKTKRTRKIKRWTGKAKKRTPK